MIPADTRAALAATIPHAPAPTASELLHGHAQRADEGRSRAALARAAGVALRGGVPANLGRRLYGSLTIGEALRAAGVLQ